MKNTLRSIIAAILCASLLCGCSADQKPAEIPADSETAVSSDVSDSGEFTAAPSTVSVESSPAPELSVNSGIAPTEDFSGETSTAESPVTSNISSETTPAQSTTGAAPEPISTAATTVKTTASTVKTSTTTKPAELTKFSVDWKLNSTWEEGENKCGGYEATLTNNSGSDVGSWTVKVTVPSGFKLTASWNGVFSVSGTTLTIKNESYNGSVPSGGNTGFGFNWSCPGDFTPSKATVNGSTASVGTNSGQNGGSVQPATTTPAVTIQTVPPAPEDPDGTTPVAAHGQLSVKGTQLVDKNGKGYQLRGMSTHGITWFPDFVNENAFRTLRDDWNTNVVRMAMYVDEWGNGQCYMQNKEGSTQLLEKGVDICIKLGMYVIIDWHVLNPGDPSQYTDEAIKFFDKISKKYADYPNIIYEIVNEPNGNATWKGVIKPYAEKVIPVIRKNDKDAVIIVGTPTWSQDIDQALADPLKYDNVMYALHFYAATHTDWLRERTEKCINGGLPIFVSEFGCCDASGNGGNDFAQTEKWLKLLDKYGVSYCNWNLANKNESSSCFKESAKADGKWSDSDYSESGAWIRKWFRNH